MIELNKFSVHIVGGNKLAGGYVEMSHGDTYKLQLRNGNFRRSDAFVYIDGKPVGAWRINENSTIVLERGVNDNGKFTFYEIGTSEALQAELHKVDNSDLGLIQVKFELENVVKPVKSVDPFENIRAKKMYRKSQSKVTMDWCDVGTDYSTVSASLEQSSARRLVSQNYCSFAGNVEPSSVTHTSGGTGLSGKSDQYFTNANELSGYDPDFSTTINLRLVTKKKQIRPIASHSNVPPLSLSH